MKELYEKEFAVLIEAYRKSLLRRYSDDNISRFPKLKNLNSNVRDKLVHYFLELLYPNHETRLELDNAFHSLGSFTHSPVKFFGVMGNLAGAVIKFGKLLIPAIHAGISALRSYLTAHKFENELYHNAKPLIDKGVDISDENTFKKLIASIPKEEADAFREQIVNLFTTLSKKELLVKILEVMDHVIEKMKKKPNLYPDSDIKGIEMGKIIISRGKDIFTELNENDIQLVIEGIDQVEKDFFERATNFK